MPQEKKIRVLIAKLGLDAHDRGALLVSRWLRDAGMEVVYLGPYQTVERVINTAIQEDADVLGLSFLSGEHLFYVPQIKERAQQNNLKDLLLVVGGVIPQGDVQLLKEKGADEIFIPGTPMETIVNYLKSAVRKKES